MFQICSCQALLIIIVLTNPDIYRRAEYSMPSNELACMWEEQSELCIVQYFRILNEKI